MRAKDEVRADGWRAMERERVARFPGAEGRIPNFAGAKTAAERLAKHHAWLTAHDIPVNLVATPRAVIEVEGAYRRPQGVLWDHLQPPQIHEVPVLERFGYAG